MLTRARAALRAGGRIVLRDAARAETNAHRRIRWSEQVATRLGYHQSVEGLHFLTLEEMTAMLRRAGFAGIRVLTGAGRGSNVLITASVPDWD